MARQARRYKKAGSALQSPEERRSMLRHYKEQIRAKLLLASLAVKKKLK
jgi:hypothetical protein